jgi:hypothetical protein
MRNVRLEGDVIVYDCDGAGCPTPGEPHSMETNAYFAALEATYKEFIIQEDPRAEAIDLAMQIVYQQIHGKDAESAPLGKKAPWHADFKKVMDSLEAHYEGVREKPDKQFMN